MTKQRSSSRRQGTTRIGLRLLVWVVLISGLVTVAATAVQLYDDYFRGISQLENRLDQIGRSYTPGLVNSLWVLDTEQAENQLVGIHTLADVGYVTIRKGDKDLFSRGTPLAGEVMIRDFPLVYDDDRGAVDLGTLRLQSSLQDVRQQLWGKGWRMLSSNAVGIVIVSAAILYLVNTLISRHLRLIAASARQFEVGNLESPLVLNRPVRKSLDELDEVVQALNDMRTQIRGWHAKLERKVRDRTASLRKSENVLANAQRIAHLGSWTLDIKVDKLTWSEETYRIFGADPRAFEVSYQSFRDAVHPDDKDAVHGEYSASVAGNLPYDIEHRIIRIDDGAVRWVHERCVQICDKGGKVVQSEGTVQDITDRKRAEFASRTNAKRIKLLLDLSREASTLSDKELLERSLDIAVAITGSEVGYLHLVNEDQKTLSLSTWNGEARKHCTAAYEAHYPIEEAGIWADSVRQKEPVVHNDYPAMERKAGYPEGHFPILRHMSAPVMDGDQARMIIGVGNKPEDYDENDIAQLQLAANDVEKLFMRRLAELALKQKTELLERSNADLQQFAYVSSHDLREPLRMVSSYLQLLERKYDHIFDDEAHEFFHFAVDGAKRMDVLIRDLLQYSRVQTHGDEFEEVASGEVLQDALDNLKTALADASGVVTFEDLPKVKADRSQLLQLFQNLIGNALKYCSDGRTPEIRVSAKISKETATFSVQDNGIGMDPKFFDRIFVIFQRLHGREEYSGTGVGLAVCKRIVERHGGTIWVESKMGEGSTFFFTLPTA